MSTATPTVQADPLPLEHQNPSGGRTTRVRWVVLALLFFGTTINYVDRQVMALLAPDLQARYGIKDYQYGNIQSAFAFCYAFGQLVSGRWLDRVGTRIGYAVALAAWSASSMLHALAGGARSFGFMRGLLGVSESPNFPAATKTLAEWFPRRERAFAFGFINAGTNMGVVVAALLVPWLAAAYGWQWAFVGTGALGLVWLLFWLPFYRRPAEHPRVNAAELAHIQSDPPEPAAHVPWVTLLTYPQAWAFAAGKFLTDSMWWFYMTWLPKFLHTKYGLDLIHVGLPLVVIYLISDAGSVGGGWLSSSMIKRGASVNRARKTALFVCALCVVPIVFAQHLTGLWPVVLILGLATAGHQGFSSNLYTLVSDTFPKRAVASVAGFGGTFGYFGASIFSSFVGYMVNDKGNYLVPFLCAGSAYLVALLMIHLLAPRLQPALQEQATPAA